MSARKHLFHIYLIFIFGTLILSGCATATLDKEGAEKLANLDVYDFVKQRFVKEEETPVSDSITNFLDKVTSFGASPEQKQIKAINKANREHEKNSLGLMPDGRTVIFQAYFNGMNNRQIKRPVTEMRLFCEANQGILTVIKLDLSDAIVRKKYDTPAAAYTRALNTNYDGYISTTFGNFYGSTTVTLPMNAYKREIAESEAYRVKIQNAYMGKRGAIKGYDDAAYGGAFGEFMCLRKSNKQALWRVMIVPVYFRANDLDTRTAQSHVLRILISPLTFSHTTS